MCRLFFLLISRVLNCLPHRFVLFCGDCIGWLWYYVVPIRRDIVLDNLRRALGESVSPAEIKAIAVKNYRHYGRCLFEILLSFSWSRKDFQNKVKVEGWDNIRPHLNSGAFILNSHMGNWEILIGAGVAHGIPADVVVKRVNTKFVNELLKWNRERMAAGLIPETGSAKNILRSLSQGRHVGFILDQFMGPPIGLPVKFFGRVAGTTVSLALLTEKKDVPVIPLYSYRDEKGILNMVAEPPVTFPKLAEEKNERLYQKTQVFNDTIERIVRRHPEQWLWLHRRWKPFRGETRWQLGKTMAGVTTALVLALVVGCSSVEEKEEAKSYTGITLPGDPTIGTPEFEEVAEIERKKKVEIQKVRETFLKRKSASKKVKPAKAPPKKKKETTFKKFKPETLPFEVGEQLEVRIGWLAIPAGTAVLEVREGPKFNGRSTYQLWGRIRSNRMVDMIYSIDNRIESFVDKEGLVPYKFLLHMLEKDQKKEIRVSFDHTKEKAFFWAKRISKKWGNQDINRQDLFMPRAQDIFSALYYARTIDYKLKRRETIPIFENGKNMEVELLPVANELVVSKAGAFQCWKILVRVRLKGHLQPMGDIYMWLSDDSKKYLVKFDAKVKIGSLRGNLVKVRDR